MKKSIDTENILLEHYYDVLLNDSIRLMKTRNWCITVWIATLVAVGSDQLKTDFIQSLILILSQNIFFWIVECLQHTYLLIDNERASEFESFISKKNDDTLLPLNYFYVSGDKKIPLCEKFKKFRYSIFKADSIWIFYLLLIASSIIFIIIFKECTLKRWITDSIAYISNCIYEMIQTYFSDGIGF